MKQAGSIVLIFAVGLASCKRGSTPQPVTSADPVPTTTSLTDLSVSLDAARTEFNAHKQEARFLTLLAPT